MISFGHSVHDHEDLGNWWRDPGTHVDEHDVGGFVSAPPLSHVLRFHGGGPDEEEHPGRAGRGALRGAAAASLTGTRQG